MSVFSLVFSLSNALSLDGQDRGHEGREQGAGVRNDPERGAPNDGLSRAPKPSDAALLEQLAIGSERALEALIERYATRLRDFAYLTTRDAALAADVVQDVFVRIWERRAAITVKGTLGDYLYRAVRNRALNVVKHESAQARLRERAPASFAIDPQAFAAAADAALMSEEFANAIRDAIQSLTPRVREVFLMHRVHDMSVSEIAAVLELSVPTVQSQLSRAAKQVVEYLAPFR